MINKKIFICLILLTNMIDGLRQVFSNNTRSLELLYLINDIKPAVRLDANGIELKKIKGFCNENSLYLEVSDFKAIKTADEGKGSYSNIVRRVPIDYSGDGLYHTYLSKDKNKAKFLKLLESRNDDKAVGQILGYPECCIDFFIRNRENQQKIQNDYILPILSNSDGLEFPFYNNYAARYFDVTLLGHFPHSFNCEESIKIAKRNLECIKKYSEELANRFVAMLKCPVLYTEKNGIFLFENYQFKNNILQFNGVKSTINNELLSLLNKNKKIEIIDKNKIKINGEIIEGMGFMLFS